jgi:cystathionine beta-lyase/cystathionine gamma-synthase
MTSSPFDSWLALRGVATLHLRMERASGNANFLAERLATHPAVSRVIYPGLRQHPDRTVAQRLFAPDMAGNMLALELPGGRSAVRQFMAGTPQIPFCPSLGEASTTLSHPASTSHRGLTPRQRAELGITEGTIRLSVGTESAEWVWGAIQQSLDTLA